MGPSAVASADPGVYDFGLFHNLRAFGFDGALFWLPTKHADKFEGYHFPAHDRPTEHSQARDVARGCPYFDAHGKVAYTSDFRDALKVSLEVYKGQTLLYPPNVQLKV